ncbi:MAG: hypothetical protein JXB26_07040 [Candidatus Aminicenantes bacterium]|nr:hypothetical protein [Candidatus Aminicenantes bacterium]
MFDFKWNPYADQPHNVALRSERRLFLLRHAGSYVRQICSNLRKAVPVLSLYRTYRKKMYDSSVSLGESFGLSVSPEVGRFEEIAGLLKEAGIGQTLFRMPSWERERMAFFEDFARFLKNEGINIGVALLQQRRDVLDPSHWKNFLDETFSRLRDIVSFFEVGHAWNRTKWGVWTHDEYIELAETAVTLAGRYGVRTAGPAVIDFEFHLYPPVLNAVSFDVISSLLYVDRVGAPENSQFGWDISRKLALLRAVIDSCLNKKKELWITEVNWPLKGTGRYSPASGKPNVSEKEQADYLVRYYILGLTSGFTQRIYWWQLTAPGYGLIDSRSGGWRKRPAFEALKTMSQMLKGAVFTGRQRRNGVELFFFRKKNSVFCVCWTLKGILEYRFSSSKGRIVDRDGKERFSSLERLIVTPSPQYVFLPEDDPASFRISGGEL